MFFTPPLPGIHILPSFHKNVSQLQMKDISQCSGKFKNRWEDLDVLFVTDIIKIS
jgi:hypothetical protein